MWGGGRDSGRLMRSWGISLCFRDGVISPLHAGQSVFTQADEAGKKQTLWELVHSSAK